MIRRFGCRAALGGFAAAAPRRKLRVRDDQGLAGRMPPERWAALRGVLKEDPRPSYQRDPERIYGMEFAGWEIRFQVRGERLTVVEVKEKG